MLFWVAYGNSVYLREANLDVSDAQDVIQAEEVEEKEVSCTISVVESVAIYEAAIKSGSGNVGSE